ncbi:hypothetical protein MWU76_11100 [Gelidibacter sp. F2691]|nr:hypothetical protein [Gelidibacter sp. F2691]
MQKEKNVSFQWSILLIIIGINFCYSQKAIEGTYVIDDVPDWAGEAGIYTYFNFENNGTFKKEEVGELGLERYGQGQYKLINDKLILDYNRSEPLKMSHHVSEIWQSNKDSITVDFIIFDFDGNPAKGVDISYRDSLSPQGYVTDVSDANGRVYFNLKKDIKELQFEISSMDYGLSVSILHSFYNVTIYKEWNYKISVYLQKSYTGIPILNQKDTLNLVKIKRKYFTVRNKNGSVTTWRKIED